MIKTTLPGKQAVAQIVSEYCILAGTSAKRATLREFADSLSDALQNVGRRVSYQSIKNWGDRRYLPDAFLMLRLSQAARYDWRGDFAADILAALHPESYEPVSEIGRRALRAGRQLAMHLNNHSHNGGTGNGSGK